MDNCWEYWMFVPRQAIFPHRGIMAVVGVGVGVVRFSHILHTYLQSGDFIPVPPSNIYRWCWLQAGPGLEGRPSRLLQHALMNPSFSPSSQSFQIALVRLFLPTDMRSARRDPGKYLEQCFEVKHILSAASVFSQICYDLVRETEPFQHRLSKRLFCLWSWADASCHEGPMFSSASADGTDAGLW